MSKKLVALLSSVLLVGAMLTACTAGSTTGGAGPKIAVVMSHLSNSFTTTVADAAKRKGAELGLRVTVFDGKKDAATQLGQIESAVAQGYDGILVEPVSQEGIAPALKAADDADVPIGTIIQQARQQERAAFYVGGDDAAAGKLEMEKAIEAIGGSGCVAVLLGPMGSDGQVQRSNGYTQVLEGSPGVELVAEQTGNWDTAEALKVTENWLSSGRGIDAIVAQNDSMAIGALKALSNAGRQDIKVFGVDATDDGIASIKSGGMVGTVSQDTAGMGALAVETLAKKMNGEQVEAINFTQATWVTKENADSFAGT